MIVRNDLGQDIDDTNYALVKAWAQRLADNSKRITYGIERLNNAFGSGGYRYVIRTLPRKDMRFGCDARCEEIPPTVPTR